MIYRALEYQEHSSKTDNSINSQRMVLRNNCNNEGTKVLNPHRSSINQLLFYTCRHLKCFGNAKN